MGGTDVEETCNQMLLEDLKTNGVKRFGNGPRKEFMEDLYEKAKEKMTGDGDQYVGLVMVSLVYDKRLNYFTLGFFGFRCGGMFVVTYGKAIRNGRVDALCKILCAKGKEIEKMPPLQPWPLTKQKEFIIYTYSFPWECELCNLLRSSSTLSA